MDYLLKTEPTVYSFADLEREKATIWDGVTNPAAVKRLREMKPGERLVIYHTGDEKSAVGTASVVAVDASDARNPQVKIKVGKAIAKPKDAGGNQGAGGVCGVSAGEAGTIERGAADGGAIRMAGGGVRGIVVASFRRSRSVRATT